MAHIPKQNDLFALKITIQLKVYCVLFNQQPSLLQVINELTQVTLQILMEHIVSVWKYCFIFISKSRSKSLIPNINLCSHLYKRFSCIEELGKSGQSQCLVQLCPYLQKMLRISSMLLSSINPRRKIQCSQVTTSGPSGSECSKETDRQPKF